MNRSNGWEENIHGSSSKKSCRSIELHPISNKRERRKWPLHPKSCHAFHSLLQNPKETCLSCRSPHIFHFFPSEWRGFGSLSNKCAHGPAELLWRRLSRDLADFMKIFPTKKGCVTPVTKREKCIKTTMKPYEDMTWCIDFFWEISHGTISISSNIQSFNLNQSRSTTKTSRATAELTIGRTSRCVFVHTCTPFLEGFCLPETNLKIGGNRKPKRKGCSKHLYFQLLCC